jgi:protease I
MKINPKNKKILIFVEEYYEDLEFWYPKIRLEEEGYSVTIAGPDKRVFHGRHGLTVELDVTFNEVKEKEFAGLIIPGGFAPDWLRRSEKVLELVRKFHKNNKLIAFICHAGWVPISAGILKGKHVTSIPSIKDDLINAGALWEDSPLVIDGNLVSSRRPADLPLFMKASIDVLNKQSS